MNQIDDIETLEKKWEASLSNKDSTRIKSWIRNLIASSASVNEEKEQRESNTAPPIGSPGR